MPKTVNPDPAWTDTLAVPVPHETMDADDVAVPDTRLLANDKWLKKEFGDRLDALERAVWPTSLNVGLTATETDAARHVWRFDYALSTNRGTVTAARLNFGDGSQEVTLSNPGVPGSLTHDYPDTGGTYTATLTATTSEGVTQSAQRTVTVAAPVGTITAQLVVEPVSGTPGGFKFTPSYSTSYGQVTGATLSFGDGTQAVTVSGPVTHTYPQAAENKTYTAVLTVTQSNGPSKTVNQVVTVSGLAPLPVPELLLTAGTALNEYQAMEAGYKALPADMPRDVAESLRLSLDWGDGSAPADFGTSYYRSSGNDRRLNPDLFHTFTKASRVTLTVTDKYGRTAKAFHDVAYAAAAFTPTSITSVTPYSLVGGQSSAGSGEGYKPVPGNRLSELHGITDNNEVIHGWRAGPEQALPATLCMTYAVETDTEPPYYSWDTRVIGFKVQGMPTTGQINLSVQLEPGTADYTELIHQLFVEYGGTGPAFGTDQMLWTDSEVLSIGSPTDTLGSVVTVSLDAAKLAHGGGVVFISLRTAAKVTHLTLQA